MNFTHIDCMNGEVFHQAHEVVEWQLLCQIFMVSIEVREQTIQMENTIIQMRNTIIPEINK